MIDVLKILINGLYCRVFLGFWQINMNKHFAVLSLGFLLLFGSSCVFSRTSIPMHDHFDARRAASHAATPIESAVVPDQVAAVAEVEPDPVAVETDSEQKVNPLALFQIELTNSVVIRIIAEKFPDLWALLKHNICEVPRLTERITLNLRIFASIEATQGKEVGEEALSWIIPLVCTACMEEKPTLTPIEDQFRTLVGEAFILLRRAERGPSILEQADTAARESTESQSSEIGQAIALMAELMPNETRLQVAQKVPSIRRVIEMLALLTSSYAPDYFQGHDMTLRFVLAQILDEHPLQRWEAPWPPVMRDLIFPMMHKLVTPAKMVPIYVTHPWQSVADFIMNHTIMPLIRLGPVRKALMYLIDLFH
ncbi:MAG: hypothetical protein LBF72_04200 [Holosporales bacterium]|jgi:hypothetical protein|nr:hypothetical protein [Holosporales bacterium]